MIYNRKVVDTVLLPLSIELYLRNDIQENKKITGFNNNGVKNVQFNFYQFNPIWEGHLGYL